jgi:hypothetical protein
MKHLKSVNQMIPVEIISTKPHKANHSADFLT